MATNILIYPFLNPLAFYKDTPDEVARYRSKDFTDWYFSDTILPWEQSVSWKQPWQTSDTIHLQLQSTYGPVTLIMYRTDGDVVDTIPFTQVIASANNPDLRIYEVHVDMSVYEAGCYYFKITFGSPVVLTLRSETIELSEIHENSLLLEAKHYRFREDMIFETGIFPGLRVRASKKFEKPGSNDTIYEDQPGNREVLRSESFRIWKLLIGGSKGIPDYIADKIALMLGCSDFLIDGKYYVKSEGATMEPNAIDDYPMRGWSIELREKLKRSSRIYESETAANAQVSVIIAVDTRGFTEGNTGDVVTIEDIL
jgi:hypothetical protein